MTAIWLLHVPAKALRVLALIASIAICTSCLEPSPLGSAVEFIADFCASRGRLPDQQEFQEWSLQYSNTYAFAYFTNRPAGMKKWGVDGRDFLVGIRPADGPLYYDYYCSWDRRIFDGYVGESSDIAQPFRAPNRARDGDSQVSP